MKKKKNVIMIIASLIIAFASTGCKNDDPVAPAAQTSTVLQVNEVGVSGTVTFIETSSTTVTIEVKLTGATAGVYPVELRTNSAVEDGTLVAALESIDETGSSSTLVTDMTYDELIDYDGHIVVYNSSLKSDGILALGDIGGNVLVSPSTSVSYSLSKVGVYMVSGKALFEKRKNGNTLVTLTMTGLTTGVSYPANICVGSVTQVGTPFVSKTLSSIDGTTGKSYTNIKALNDNVSIKYIDWLVYVGYINVYKNSETNADIISSGNIGLSTTL